jgi:hypothetical protein
MATLGDTACQNIMIASLARWSVFPALYRRSPRMEGKRMPVYPIIHQTKSDGLELARFRARSRPFAAYHQRSGSSLRS